MALRRCFAKINPLAPCVSSRQQHKSISSSFSTFANPVIPVFDTPSGMYKNVLDITRNLKGDDSFRNFVGTIRNMEEKKLAIDTELFSADVLDFYTKHNLDLISDQTHHDLYQKHYNAARGGAQGDYRDGIQEKINNIAECLTKFPGSKRAVLTVPYSTEGSKTADHTDDGQAKCLRELHFHLTNDHTGKHLHASGFMRAQAATIFPKNIHYIGTLMNIIALKLGVQVGSYTHTVTCLVAGR